MDNHGFDDIIRRKALNYKDKGVDVNALSDFHNRLDTTAILPWYMPYKTIASYAAVVLLVSLINFGIFSQWNNKDEPKWNTSIAQMVRNENQLCELKEQIEYLTLIKRDTIYVPQNNKLLNASGNAIDPRVAEYSAIINNLRKQNNYLTDFKSLLLAQDLIYEDENGVLYVKNNTSKPEKLRSIAYPNQGLAFNYPIFQLDDKEEDLVEETATKKKKEALPASVIREMEKQKMDGIGFQFGPALTLYQPITEIGRGEHSFGAGVMAEFVLSPLLQLETGVLYNRTGYEVISPIEESIKDNFPAINNDIGELKEIKVVPHILSFPIHLKYMHPTSHKSKLFIGGGWSPHLFVNQRFNYQYASTIDIDGESDFDVNVTAEKRIDEGRFFTGTIDMTLGTQRKLKSGNYFELSAFYNRSIGQSGPESQTYNMVGIKSALLFRVK